MDDGNKNGEIFSDELLASVAKSAYNAILILNKKGEIQWANAGFTKLYGYSLSEYNSIKKDDDNSFITLLNEIDPNFFKNNPALSLSRIIFTNKGERKWVQSTITPVNDSKNKIIRFIVIDTDITQQKEVEEELVQRQENTQTLSEHLESVKDYVEDQIKELNEQKRAVELAKEKSEEVLNKVLPYEVAIQLKKKGYATPRHYKKVTLLQLCIRNFMSLADIIPIESLVEQLHKTLVTIDSILEQHYVEKIKTAGGNYLGAGGVPLRNRSNPIDVVLAALKIKEAITELNSVRRNNKQPEFELGFGIHTGKAIAGVVGKNKLSYDIWGDTVNISAAVQRNANIGEVIITQETYDSIKEYFECTLKDAIVLNTADEINLYEVIRIKEEYTGDENGVTPNANFYQLLSKL